MAKHNSTQLEAQQGDQVQGIEIRPLNGRDFQPSGTSISYDCARAQVVASGYTHDVKDTIVFTLTGEASFDGKNPGAQTTTRPVTSEGFADVTFYGLVADPVARVVLSATLSKDPEVSGTRNVTFMAYPIATTDQLGCVIVGDGLEIKANKLSVKGSGSSSYTLPIATPSILGGVKKGTNIQITGDGILSVATATAAGAGVVPLASLNEVQDGLDASKAVTAKDLKTLYAPLASPQFSGTPFVIQPDDSVKMRIAKSADFAAGAPTTLDNKSVYLQLGGGEYGRLSYRMLGFGYVFGASPPPLLIGYQEMASQSGSTGDFLVATRSADSLDVSTEKFRISAGGQVTITNDQTAVGYKAAPQELVAAQLLNRSTQGMITIPLDPKKGGGSIDLHPEQVSHPIIQFTGVLGGDFYVRMLAVGRWTIINDCTGEFPVYLQYSASYHPELPVYSGQRVDIVVVDQGAGGIHTYLVAPQVLTSGGNVTVSGDGKVSVISNPNFTGTATITSDQTKNIPGDQELVTSKYLKSRTPTPTFFEIYGTNSIKPPFIGGSTWLMGPGITWDCHLDVFTAATLEVGNGDWFMYANVSQMNSFKIKFSDSVFVNGFFAPAGTELNCLPGMCVKAF